MKILSVLVAIMTFFTAHYMQIELRANTEKYNLITPDISSLPEPVDSAEEGFVQLSDVNMHYKRYGNGNKAVILIHGNGGSADSLSELASYLATEFTVYTPSSRCQGKSSNPGVISYELMAKDIYEFGNAMGLEHPLVMGHSDGGMVAIALAANYPDYPAAIISCGSNSNPSTFWWYFRFGVKVDNLKEKNILNDLMLEQPDFTEEYLSRIICPSYIVCGEYDIMPLSDTVYIHESIKGSDMAVIKGENHGSYISQNGKKAYIIAIDWLNEKGLK